MKISIVKESGLLREGMLNILKGSSLNHSFHTYNSSNYNELLFEQLMSDIVIVDIDLDIDLFRLIHFYKEKNKKVIIWTSSLMNERLLDLFKLDLDGYFFNDMYKDELITAISTVINGGTYMHSKLAKVLLSDYIKVTSKKETKRPAGILSKREWEVLECLSKGMKNEEIGKSLFISNKTVNNHVSNILQKLKVNDRTNAVLKAFQNEWLTV